MLKSSLTKDELSLGWRDKRSEVRKKPVKGKYRAKEKATDKNITPAHVLNNENVTPVPLPFGQTRLLPMS